MSRRIAESRPVCVGLTEIFFEGILRILSKNVFVRPSGQDKDNCGNWTLPCHSVRYAVKIARANDVIHIDYAEGKPYRECEHPRKNQTIMLDKSLSFHGFKGKAILYCEQTLDTFFAINSSEDTTLKIVFSNLSLAIRGGLLDAIYNISTKFELEFNFCDIKRSSYFVKASSLSCSIQVLNSSIRSDLDPISLNCHNLTARFNGSTFFSCQIKLSVANAVRNDSKPETTVHIYNCTFNMTKKPLPCDSLITIISGTSMLNMRIRSCTFVNFYGLVPMPKSAALMISSLVGRIETTIVLDKLHFENINCYSAVVYMHLWISPASKLFNVGILNSVFVNTTRAIQCYMERWSLLPFFENVQLYNNTFNNTNGIVRKEGLVYLAGGRYLFSSCRFLHNVPVYNPDFPLIRAESSVTITFENFSYNSYSIGETSRDGSIFYSNMYYIISYESITNDFVMKGNFTISCPQGYKINYNRNCHRSGDLTVCGLFRASCEQCEPKTYSLQRGIVHNNTANKITCRECPVGGNCLEGQVTSKKNFWGYKSNWTVKFLQCPLKYCKSLQTLL